MLSKLSIYLFLLLIIPDIYIYKSYINRRQSVRLAVVYSFRDPIIRTRLDSTIL